MDEPGVAIFGFIRLHSFVSTRREAEVCERVCVCVGRRARERERLVHNVLQRLTLCVYIKSKNRYFFAS